MAERTIGAPVGAENRKLRGWISRLTLAVLAHAALLAALLTAAVRPVAPLRPLSVAVVIEPAAPASAIQPAPQPAAETPAAPAVTASAASAVTASDQAAAGIIPAPPARLGDVRPSNRPPRLRGAAARPHAAAPPPARTQPDPPAVPPSPPAAAMAAAEPAPRPAAPGLAGAWRDALVAWLQTHRSYPDAARRAGVEGSPVVRFTLDATGAVLGVSLVKSSGAPSLDEAALTLMRDAHVPLPPSTLQGGVVVTLPIRYRLRE